MSPLVIKKPTAHKPTVDALKNQTAFPRLFLGLSHGKMRMQCSYAQESTVVNDLSPHRSKVCSQSSSDWNSQKFLTHRSPREFKAHDDQSARVAPIALRNDKMSVG